MRYIFVDNFRGFKETLLSIRDVNFLVGENSTGKTSLLALIALLGSPHFWFDQRFSTDEIKLGMFKDIVSVSSQDKTYFRIGLAEIDDKRARAENSDDSFAFLCTFTEEDGMPIINHYSALRMGEQVHVHFTTKSSKYKLEGKCDLVDAHEAVREMFLRWANSHQKVGTGYTSLRSTTLGMAMQRRAPLAYIGQFLDDIIRKKRGVASNRRAYLGLRLPFREIVWLAPIRTRPQRTYDTYRLDFSPDGEHTPYLIKRLLTKRTSEQSKQAEKFERFIEAFGKDSGLFRSISIKDYDKRTTTSPFELDILLAREALSVDNVGYGISQALPVIVELFYRPKDTWFAVQQPEIHLHPRAQSALGNVIFDLAISQNKRFVIETHSDFTIDGFRLHYKDKEAKHKPDAQIVFFERKDGHNTLYEIPILPNGEISDNQPSAYREFFIKEEMHLLGL